MPFWKKLKEAVETAMRWIFGSNSERRRGERRKNYHWVRDRRNGHMKPENFEEASKMPSRVEAVAKLMDAILEAWTHCLIPPYGSGKFTPEDGQTDCNGFVDMVARSWGFTGFRREGAKWPMRANEMYDFLTEAQAWHAVSGDSAQYYANHGYLAIAAWKNPDPEKSGHVAVVRPGTLGTSGKWGYHIPKVPKVANVGPPQGCRIDRGSNWAFDGEPQYFVLLEDTDARVRADA